MSQPKPFARKILGIAAISTIALVGVVSCGENNDSLPTGSTNEETAHGDFANKAWERIDENGDRIVVRLQKIAKTAGYAFMQTKYCKDMNTAAVLAKVTAINAGVSSNENRRQSVNGCVAELKDGTYSMKVRDGQLRIARSFVDAPTEVYNRAETYDLGYSCQFTDLGGSGEACMEVYSLTQDKNVCTAAEGKVSQKSCKTLMNKDFTKSCALNTVQNLKQLQSQMIYFYDEDKPVTCPN